MGVGCIRHPRCEDGRVREPYGGFPGAGYGGVTLREVESDAGTLLRGSRCGCRVL